MAAARGAARRGGAGGATRGSTLPTRHDASYPGTRPRGVAAGLQSAACTLPHASRAKMANIFRGRLQRTEGAYFAKKERTAVGEAAEKLREAAGANAARVAAANAARTAKAPTVDILPEVMGHSRVFRVPETDAPDIRKMLGLDAGPGDAAGEAARHDRLKEAARKGKEEGLAYYARKRELSAEQRALAEYRATAPLRVAARAFFWGTALAIGSFSCAIGAFCSYYGIGSIEQMQAWTDNELRPWARATISVPLGVAHVVDEEDEAWVAGLEMEEEERARARAQAQQQQQQQAQQQQQHGAVHNEAVPTPPAWRPHGSTGERVQRVQMRKSETLNAKAAEIKSFFRSALGVKAPADAEPSEDGKGDAAGKPQYSGRMFSARE